MRAPRAEESRGTAASGEEQRNGGNEGGVGHGEGEASDDGCARPPQASQQAGVAQRQAEGLDCSGER